MIVMRLRGSRHRRRALHEEEGTMTVSLALTHALGLLWQNKLKKAPPPSYSRQRRALKIQKKNNGRPCQFFMLRSLLCMFFFHYTLFPYLSLCLCFLCTLTYIHPPTHIHTLPPFIYTFTKSYSSFPSQSKKPLSSHQKATVASERFAQGLDWVIPSILSTDRGKREALSS